MADPVLVLGDAHAERADRRRSLFAAYRASEARVALQCGDLGHYKLPIQTYFIGGNNEDFDIIAALRHGRLESADVGNVQLLHSTVAEVAGLRVAGLTGNYAPSRFERTRQSLSGERRRHFVADEVEQACQLQDVDVFLTHQAPHGLPVDEDYRVGNDAIDRIIGAVSPDLCLVGHHHEHAETTIADTRVISLAPAWERYYELDPDGLTLQRQDTPPV
ncbi:MAG: metallophosphoesterase [Halobacteriaceae archaeon]